MLFRSKSIWSKELVRSIDQMDFHSPSRFISPPVRARARPWLMTAAGSTLGSFDVPPWPHAGQGTLIDRRRPAPGGVRNRSGGRPVFLGNAQDRFETPVHVTIGRRPG